MSWKSHARQSPELAGGCCKLLRKLPVAATPHSPVRDAYP